MYRDKDSNKVRVKDRVRNSDGDIVKDRAETDKKETHRKKQMQIHRQEQRYIQKQGLG